MKLENAGAESSVDEYYPTVTKPTAGIKSPFVHAAANNGLAYNLAGQRVSDSYKGIVIVNGRKMIRK